MEKSKLTPWEAPSSIDYSALIKEFGVVEIKGMLENLPDRLRKKIQKCHPLLKRGFYYAHRDFDLWLNDYGKKKISVITGRGSSEKMHIGHLVAFMMARSLQEHFGCEVFIPISDDEKFFVKEDLSFEDAIAYGKDNIVDLLALGFEEGKTFVFQDLVNTEVYRFASRIAKKITYSEARAIFGLKPESNIGWSFYPAMQAAHILMPQWVLGKHRSVVPVGIDQDPFIRLTRDIAKYFDFEKPAGLYSKFLPALTGEAKMSASEKEKVIWLTDSPEQVREKIIKHAFSGGQPTAELHRKLGGNPDIDISFQYLKMLFELDDKKIAQIEQDYRSGKLLTSELKEILIEKIVAFLKKHQQARTRVAKRVKKFVLDFSKFSELP